MQVKNILKRLHIMTQTLRLIRLIWYPYWYPFLPFYDHHKCQKMTFYDGHKMSSNDIKVWQCGYQIDRIDLNISVMISILEHIWLVRRNKKNKNLKNILYLVPFIKFNLVAYRHFWSFRAGFFVTWFLIPIHSLGFLAFLNKWNLIFWNSLLFTLHILES